MRVSEMDKTIFLNLFSLLAYLLHSWQLQSGSLSSIQCCLSSLESILMGAALDYANYYTIITWENGWKWLIFFIISFKRVPDIEAKLTYNFYRMFIIVFSCSGARIFVHYGSLNAIFSKNYFGPVDRGFRQILKMKLIAFWRRDSA